MSYYNASMIYNSPLIQPSYMYNTNSISHTHTDRHAGNYTVHSVIGVGTYGEVRVGIDMNTNIRVAIKIIDFSRFNDDTILLIRKEIKILKHITGHENIVSIIETCDNISYDGEFCDNCACTEYKSNQHNTMSELCQSCNHSKWEHTATETRNVLMIVQELCVGGEIFGLVSNCGLFNEALSRYLFIQLLHGIQHCHMNGVIHRDLKPENLVLDHYFNLKIVDFGLAALIDSEQSHLSHRLHSGVGSQPYSAPEVYYVKELYNSTPYNGHAADVWSCAVILYVMLTGRPPFVRPLDRTHTPHLRKCKHFISLMNGDNYYNISDQAKHLLQSMFQINANDRPTIQQILQHPWLSGPVPSYADVCAQLESRAKKVWLALEKPELIDCMKRMRNKITQPHQQSQPINIQNNKQSSLSSQSTGLSPLFDRTGINHIQSPIISSNQNIFDSDIDVDDYMHTSTTATSAAISIHKPGKVRQSHIPQSYYQLSTSTSSSITPTPNINSSYITSTSHTRTVSATNTLLNMNARNTITNLSDAESRHNIFSSTPPRHELYTNNQLPDSESCSNINAHTLSDVSQNDRTQLYHHNNTSHMLPDKIELPTHNNNNNSLMYDEQTEKYADDEAKTPIDDKDTLVNDNNVNEINLSDAESEIDDNELNTDSTAILSLSRSFHSLETPPRSSSTHSNTINKFTTKTDSVSPIINAHHYNK